MNIQKTLKGWQKLYPDAIKIEAKGSIFLSDEYLKKIVDKDGKAKVLQNTSTGMWSSKKGNQVTNRAIVSKMAYEEKQDNKSEEL